MNITEISIVLFTLLVVFNTVCAVRSSLLKNDKEAMQYYYRAMLCMVMVNGNIILNELSIIKELLTN